MFQKVKSVKLYEQVFKQLSELIEQGVYREGDFLPSEKELIETTGVSRVTIRQALRILHDMGYIETIQGKGSRVILSHQEADEKYTEEQLVDFQVHRANHEMADQVRLLMEPEIAKLAARVATDEDIEYIRNSLEREKEKLTDKQRDFHHMVIRSVKIPYLLDVYDDMMELERTEDSFEALPPTQQAETAKELDRQHHKIYEAIRSHNEEFAYFYMKEHQTYVTELYRRYFDELNDLHYKRGMKQQ